MAKPGSSAAAAIAGGVDLSRAKTAELAPEKAAEALRKYELQQGLRCAGCGERIGTGFRFTRLKGVRGPDGAPAVGRASVSACNGHGADGSCEFASEARDGATYVEPIEVVWLDEQERAELAAEDAEAPADVSPAVSHHGEPVPDATPQVGPVAEGREFGDDAPAAGTVEGDRVDAERAGLPTATPAG